MYRTVYWHRQVRSATAMVKKALINALETSRISGEELYDLDDMSLFTLLKEKTDSPLVQAVLEGRVFSPAIEIPAEKVNISALRDLKYRAEKEKQLEAVLGAEGVIIDIPEAISFETGLFVVDEERHFSESSSAFKTETVNSFVKTLYTVRIFINQQINEKLKEKIKTLPNILDILYNNAL